MLCACNLHPTCCTELCCLLASSAADGSSCRSCLASRCRTRLGAGLGASALSAAAAAQRRRHPVLQQPRHAALQPRWRAARHGAGLVQGAGLILQGRLDGPLCRPQQDACGEGGAGGSCMVEKELACLCSLQPALPLL